MMSLFRLFFLALVVSSVHATAETTHGVAGAPRAQAPRVGVPPTVDYTGKSIDAGYYSRMPTIVAVGTGEEDLPVLKKLYKDFLTSLANRRFLDEVKSAGILETAKKALAKDPCLSEKDVQIALLTDTRNVWESAYAQGWATAWQTARQEHPLMFGGPVRRGIMARNMSGHGLLTRRNVPAEVEAGVQAEVKKRFDATAAALDTELSGALSKDRVRIGGLTQSSESQTYFTQLLGPGPPRMRILLVDTDGTVLKSWGKDDAAGIAIAGDYKNAVATARARNPDLARTACQ